MEMGSDIFCTCGRWIPFNKHFIPVSLGAFSGLLFSWYQNLAPVNLREGKGEGFRSTQPPQRSFSPSWLECFHGSSDWPESFLEIKMTGKSGEWIWFYIFLTLNSTTLGPECLEVDFLKGGWRSRSSSLRAHTRTFYKRASLTACF